jgi:quinol monooxygenase YgiN
MKTLFVTLRAKDKQAAELLLSALRNLKAVAAAESGIMNYEIFQSEENELHYYVRETWESEEALQRHLKTQQIAELVELSKTVLTEMFTALSLKML